MTVHAWCLMSNHYHLLLETPQGNLVSGMKWLQGTFTQRYNALYKLWGHLFQGRYKAKVIDDDDGHYFRTVGDYIHLNPADAGLVKPGKLLDWPWSSYPHYLTAPSKRPEWLKTASLLNACGIPKDSPAGRKAYAAYMDLRHQSVAATESKSPERLEWERMERGWIHGSAVFRDRMLDCIKEQDPDALKHAHDADQRKALGEEGASEALAACLALLEFTNEDLKRMKKADPHKLLIAGLLRYRFPVSVSWVAEVLDMGHYTTVSRSMHFFDDPGEEWEAIKQIILRFTG